jgi:hypothetical protein
MFLSDRRFEDPFSDVLKINKVKTVLLMTKKTDSITTLTLFQILYTVLKYIINELIYYYVNCMLLIRHVDVAKHMYTYIPC